MSSSSSEASSSSEWDSENDYSDTDSSVDEERLEVIESVRKQAQERCVVPPIAAWWPPSPHIVRGGSRCPALRLQAKRGRGAAKAAAEAPHFPPQVRRPAPVEPRPRPWPLPQPRHRLTSGPDQVHQVARCSSIGAIAGVASWSWGMGARPVVTGHRGADADWAGGGVGRGSGRAVPRGVGAAVHQHLDESRGDGGAAIAAATTGR